MLQTVLWRLAHACNSFRVRSFCRDCERGSKSGDSLYSANAALQCGRAGLERRLDYRQVRAGGRD